MKVQECSRLRGVENERIRVAVKAEEDRLCEEEKEKQAEVLRIAEAAALAELNRLKQIEVDRQALELEVKREQQEMADMSLMESESRLAWAREKLLESANAVNCVLCLPCTANGHRRKSKKTRRIKQQEYDNDEVEEEEKEEDEGDCITGHAERPPMSAGEIMPKMQEIKALEVDWMSRIERVADSPLRIHFMQGMQAPDVADLMKALSSEQSVNPTHMSKDNFPDQM